MKKLIFSVYLSLLLPVLFAPATLRADQLFLSMPVDATGLSLGQSGSSYIQGPAAMFYNPANIITQNIFEAQINHIFLGNDVNASSGMATMSITPFFTVGAYFKTLFLSESFQRVQDFSDVSQKIGVFNTVLGLSGAIQLSPLLKLGLNAKYFRMELGQETSQSVNADVGGVFSFPLGTPIGNYRMLTFSMYFENLGPKIDYYSGGQSALQPITIRYGMSYGLYPWLNVMLDYNYSFQEMSSVHIGGDFLPNYFVSPKLGLKFDLIGGNYVNYSVSFGSGFRYGEQLKFDAVIGTALGSTLSMAQTFVSLYVTQKSDFGDRRIIDSDKTLVEKNRISLKQISSSYLPYKLIPYESGYRAEKIQVILLSEETSAGFLQKNTLMHRIAIQPEDQVYLERMATKRERQLRLVNRPVAIWLKFEEFSEEDAIGNWDEFSNVVEAVGNFEVLTGNNLENLNNNVNAPKRIEFQVTVKLEKGKDGLEIKSRITELYTHKILIAKNFAVKDGDDYKEIWHNVCNFFAEYFKNVQAYFLIEMEYLDNE